MLRNVVGGVQFFGGGGNITKMYSSMLLALRGGGWVSIMQKKTLRNNLTLRALKARIEPSVSPNPPITSRVVSARFIDVSRYFLRDAYRDTVCKNRDTHDLTTFLHFYLNVPQT